VTSLTEALRSAVTAAGLAWRGTLAVGPGDQLPPLPDGRPVVNIVLIGMTGPAHWAAFRQSAEAVDGAPDPLDRWSRRQLQRLAAEFTALPLHPADGPPWWPFQRWAERAEPVHRSPLGLLIHPEYGLWHAYRGALALADPVPAPPPPPQPSPCLSCRSRPCLTACPVGAYTTEGLAVRTCAGFLAGPTGEACLGRGCAARRACPVGTEHAQSPDQARFHLEAFLHNHPP
jgi:hypothetical protein